MKDLLRSLAVLRDEVENCDVCPEAKDRDKIVFGEGDPSSGIIIIGEGPSKRGNEIGKPFVGRSKAIFDKLLDSIGVDRSEIYLMNITKCKGVEKKPTKSMIKKCSKWTWNQIMLIEPRLIVTVGSEALRFFFPKAKISEMRGAVHNFGGNLLLAKSVKILPIHHPMKIIYEIGQIKDENDRRISGTRAYKEMAEDIKILKDYMVGK